MNSLSQRHSQFWISSRFCNRKQQPYLILLHGNNQIKDGLRICSLRQQKKTREQKVTSWGCLEQLHSTEKLLSFLNPLLNSLSTQERVPALNHRMFILKFHLSKVKYGNMSYKIPYAFIKPHPHCIKILRGTLPRTTLCF